MFLKFHSLISKHENRLKPKFRFVCLFIVLHRTQEFFTYMGDVTIIVKGQQNLALCSAFRAFEQGGIFIVPHLL
jgi:hypothetical protein